MKDSLLRIKFVLGYFRSAKVKAPKWVPFFVAEKERTSALIFAKARIRSSWTNEKRQL